MTLDTTGKIGRKAGHDTGPRRGGGRGFVVCSKSKWALEPLITLRRPPLPIFYPSPSL